MRPPAPPPTDVRVLFYNTSRVWSGSARAFAAAARGLGERGHHVTYVCSPESAVEQRLGVAEHEVVAMRTDGWWPLAASRLRDALDGRFIEVVFVHSEREQLVGAAAARLAERSAVVRRIPAGTVITLGRAGKFALRLAATGFLTGAEEEMRLVPVTRRASFAPVAAPLGVDVDRYDAIKPVPRPTIGAGATSNLIVCVYDLTSRLRAATMLRSIGLLAPLHPDVRLALVGPGSDDEDLRMHAAALGLTKIVSFLGERDDYLSVLRAADLGWVLASGDNAAFAYLDLLASRIPVLAERGPLAQMYVADGIAGILLPAGDAAGTAAAVARLLAHTDRRGAMGNAGRARVAREFTEAAMLDGFERAAVAAGDRSRWRQ